MRRRLGAAGLTLLLAQAIATPAPASAETISFGKSLLQGERSSFPTSLQFGPDGRLYVAQQDGLIRVYKVVRLAANDYEVVATETLTSVRDIPNHEEVDGSPAPDVMGRLVTGLFVTGTAEAPVVYVTSSDPRRAEAGDPVPDSNSGVISRLTWNGSGWDHLDLVRGLPRSVEVHATNGLALDAATNTLYVAQGGNTNMGAPSGMLLYLPEYALSGAVLAVDLDAIGDATLDLRTLNDRTRPGTPDPNDPFGGNAGRNQARLTKAGPVSVYSPGYRNPYDLALADNGYLYVTDNGANAGQGDVPIGEGPEGTCTNEPNEPGVHTDDSLHVVTAAGYYAGHANPTRGNQDNTFGGQSPVPQADPIECDHQDPGSESGAIATFPDSTNGIARYTASNFGGAMAGDLLAAGWGEDVVRRIVLDAAGTSVTSSSPLFTDVGRKPLDVIAQGDDGPFPGTIWVADHHAGSIIVFEPSDYEGNPIVCTSADEWDLDDDGDGFANADEIDNGTDPCSPADRPTDADGDLTSNLNDPDDDNDGAPDTSDPFAVDASDGRDTALPVRLTWDPEARPPGGILDTGFTGLMSDGATDYEQLFDANAMTLGGISGVITVDKVPGGDALDDRNTQRFGFQLGVDVDPAVTGPFEVSTRIVAPFAGTLPEERQSLGLAFGTGGQDDYVKVVVAATDGGSIEFLREVGGAVSARRQAALALPGPDFVDLYLTIDPAAATARPSYRVVTGGTSGPRTSLGAAIGVPASWFSGAAGPAPAVGIIATSAGPGEPFPATWDLLKVRSLASTAAPATREGAWSPEPAAAGTWATLTPTGSPRQEITFVRVGRRFYLAGGATTLHQVYVPSRDRWRSAPAFPVALNHAAAGVLDGLIYYVGGWTSRDPPRPISEEVHVYDPEQKVFSTVAPLPEGRQRAAGAAVVHDGTLYFAGGVREGVSVPWVDAYDPLTDSWASLPDMPRGRDHFGLAVVGDRMYAVGGRQNKVSITEVDVYDFTTEEWTPDLAPVPTVRSGFATGVVGSRILVIGGEAGEQVFDTVEAYNTGKDRWRTLPSMPTARHGMQAVSLRGSLYVAAGGAAPRSESPTDVNEVLVLGGG